jgi:SPP1 family phage portal protein
MVLQKTDKAVLTSEEILEYISNYETGERPHLDTLWEYYCGRNAKIFTRKAQDPNNPNNKVIVSYGRKLVTTYTGYGYRPKYITYKANVKKSKEELEEVDDTGKPIEKPEPLEKIALNELQKIYTANNEHIKTNRAGRNLAVFGLSYEVLYVDKKVDILNEVLPIQSIPKFFTVDPRDMIVLYNYDPEPKIVIAIRFYKMTSTEYKVEVYYKDKVVPYIRYKTSDNATKWELKPDGAEQPNPFIDVPVIAYYRGDEMQSITENVLTLIDAYDILMSDSLNEFDRFAFAYLVMKRISLTTPADAKDPEKSKKALQELKRRRVFEGLDKDSDIKFLTKDIPTTFIDSMVKKVKEEIHLQSHIPDFAQLTGALSGAAIDRLLFDFENLVSSDEADFDVGLIRRGELITALLKTLSNVLPKQFDFSTMVSINHKRNVPLNKSEYATLALTMSSAGFSRKCILENMPEDMVQDVENELEEENKEQESMINFNEGDNVGDNTDEFGNPIETSEGD